MRIGTWVHGDLGGKRDSSVKVERPFFAAFQRSPIIDEIRQPVYPASLAARRTPARERERCTRTLPSKTEFAISRIFACCRCSGH